MNKVGRNEPCPCGSGKKYKNCCFRSVTTVQLNKIVEVSRHQEGLAKFAFDHFHEEMGSQTRNYIEKYKIGRDEEQTYANLMVCWLMFHSDVKDGRSPISYYLKEQKGKEQPEILDIIADWEKSFPSVYKMISKVNRNTFLLQDVMTDQEYTVEFNSEILPHDGSNLAGSIIYTGEHYEFYIDFAEIPQGELQKRLDVLTDLKITLKDDFPKALQVLLSKLEKAADEDAVPQPADRVLSLLKENASEEIYNEAERIWNVWNKTQNPIIRKEQPYAAALHYLASKDILNEPATQSEVAQRYGTSASSLSAKYRQLKTALN